MSGKMYNGEKAIISLTSWKKRISSVGLTIFSLLHMCPGFHIVLTLCEAEFPRNLNDLPLDLQILANSNKIEIIFIKKNYKSFKKVLPVMHMHKDVPVISADDDCIYTCNYAEKLYTKWLKNPTSVITNDGKQYNEFYISRGTNTLFPPRWCDNIIPLMEYAFSHNLNNDDALYCVYNYIHDIKVIDCNEPSWAITHDEIMPQSKNGYDVDNDFTLWFSYFMNRPLISSDCISGHMYKDVNHKYAHPFIWVVIPPADMIKLVSKWHTINFSNIRFDVSNILQDKYNEYQVIIDELVHVHFIHIKESPNDKIPRKVQHTKWGGDIFYCNPTELIKRQYIDRLARLKTLNKEPLFLINTQPAWGYTPDIVCDMLRFGRGKIYSISSMSNSYNFKVSKTCDTYTEGRTVRLYLAAKYRLLKMLCN